MHFATLENIGDIRTEKGKDYIEWPEFLLDKHEPYISFEEQGFASVCNINQEYAEEFLEDINKYLNLLGISFTTVISLLYEDGYVGRAILCDYKPIRYSFPDNYSKINSLHRINNYDYLISANWDGKLSGDQLKYFYILRDEEPTKFSYHPELETITLDNKNVKLKVEVGEDFNSHRIGYSITEALNKL